MLYRLPAESGTLSSVHQVFSVVQARYNASHRIVYFNNTSPAVLTRALGESKLRWVSEPERTAAFEYEHVSSVFDLVSKLAGRKYDLVVVERLDAIMQEQTLRSYGEQNDAVCELMMSETDVVFIDSWAYLDTYFLREELE